ncbi:hypothetical protein PVK06_039720 [Gossypium arboreum]|uniref:Arabidopsis retrotransposon Orf1 C-terminal domain-containing protein n=1 Tax=Gossypium arboreum TaxID=29729 RepID=A0ABR0N3M4_GOSAR|nr:hypothetical protein PVK06_039720 [Gossypium arboreum]
MTNTQGKKTAVPASKKRKGLGATSSSASTEVRHPLLQFSSSPQDDLFQLFRVQLTQLVCFHLDIAPWDGFFAIIEPIYSELTLEFCTTFHLQHVINTHDEAGTINFRLGGLVRHMSVPKFGDAFGLYTEEFMASKNFLQLHRHIYYSPSCCWTDLTVITVPYDASRSKATSLPPTLRYIHVILAHTLTGRRESTGVVSSTNAYFLWSMATGHHDPYEDDRAMPWINPLQYRLVQSNDQDEPEDITDDIPPLHEDPPQPPPSSHLHTPSTTSFRGVSFEEFTDFYQYYAQRYDSLDARFDTIDETLRQIREHLHISPPAPPAHDTNGEDL